MGNNICVATLVDEGKDIDLHNVAWECLACGVITEHPSATKTPAIRKTTLCLKCYRSVSPEKTRAYRARGVSGIVEER